jgi:hypothetical protein
MKRGNVWRNWHEQVFSPLKSVSPTPLTGGPPFEAHDAGAFFSGHIQPQIHFLAVIHIDHFDEHGMTSSPSTSLGFT